MLGVRGGQVVRSTGRLAFLWTLYIRFFQPVPLVVHDNIATIMII
jgi:hypothetical protein